MSRELPTNETKLNDQERVLLLRHPIDGARVLAAANEATNETVRLYNPPLHNTNGDAFRHALWNFLMTTRVSEERAQEWGGAHENGTVNNPPLEKQMDLHNNQVGRELGRNSGSDSDAIPTVRNAVRAGRARRIVNGQLVATNSDGEKH